MVTLAGTVMLALLLDSMTCTPRCGAVFVILLPPVDDTGTVKLTVQLADPGAATTPGEQVKLEGTIEITKLTVADFCWPLRVAVTVTL